MHFRVDTRRSVIAKARCQSLTIPCEILVDKGALKRDFFRVLRFCLIDISPPMVYTHLHLHKILTTTSRRILGIFKQSIFYCISKEKCREWNCHTVFFRLRTSNLTSRAARSLQLQLKLESGTHDYKERECNEYFGYSIWCCNKDKGRPNMSWRHRRGVEVYLSFLTSALDGNRWSTPSSIRFTTVHETWYPLYGRLSGPRSRSGWEQRDDSLPAPELERSLRTKILRS